MQMELHLANEQCVECQSSGPAVDPAPEAEPRYRSLCDAVSCCAVYLIIVLVLEILPKGALRFLKHVC